MNLQDIYQQFYFSEVDRKEYINNSLAIPLGIISAIATAFVVVAKEIDIPFDVFEKTQLFFLALTAFCLIATTYFLIRAWLGYPYGHMPRANELLTYFKELNKYYIELELPESEAKSKAEEETLEYISEKHAEYAEMNSVHNDKKSLYLFRANIGTVLSVILLVLSSAPYVINEICSPEKPKQIELKDFNNLINNVKSSKSENSLTKIEIVNLKELKMPETTPPKPTQSPNSSAQPQKPPPQKPTPPQGRVSLEHLEPKKK